MDSLSYSDHPISAYMLDLGGHACEVATLASLGEEDCNAYWNFFWLSNPRLDHLPGSGRDWWRKYSPTDGLMSSVIHDVTGDYMLHHALSLHPSGFLEWWLEQEHSDFHTYSVAGGKVWVDMVSRRAEAVCDRLNQQFPPVISAGNVLVLADFRARACNSR